jgi:hypothetical protein
MFNVQTLRPAGFAGLRKTQGGMQPLEVRRAILKALPDDQYVGQHAYWNSVF